MNFDYSSGYPEMSCFDDNAIETYFQDLTGQIKVDDSITNWTLSIEISLGGAIGEKEICIGKRGITLSLIHISIQSASLRALAER